jgi:uncharacterized protein
MKEALPTGQSDREYLVDIIRGFALVGVLLANFSSYVEQQTPEPILNAISTWPDRFLSGFNVLFLEWKFMNLFSILFGYGFGLILESVSRKNINPNTFFLKRMIWLFVFGFIHCLFWWGDVLHLYAMSGILLLFFKERSTKTILYISVVCMFLIPVCIAYLLRNRPETFTAADMASVYMQYKQESLIDLFSFNLQFYYRMFIDSGSNFHDIIQTLGRFLFGFFLMRVRFFQSPDSKTAMFRKIIAISGPLAISYFVFRWLLMNDDLDLNRYLTSLILSVGIFCTTTFYVCMLVLAYLQLGMNRFFSALRDLGRMTLSNYLLISTFLVLLLYGVGSNKLGEISIHTSWLLAFMWLCIEVLFSTLWLKTFRFGPMEWVWRQLTYWKRIPIAK